MTTYLLAIGPKGDSRRYLVSDTYWSPRQADARRFFDRVTLRVAQIRQSRQQTKRVRVIRLLTLAERGEPRSAAKADPERLRIRRARA